MDCLAKMVGMLNEPKATIFFQFFNPLNWISGFLKILLWLFHMFQGGIFNCPLFTVLVVCVLICLGFTREQVVEILKIIS